MIEKTTYTGLGKITQATGDDNSLNLVRGKSTISSSKHSSRAMRRGGRLPRNMNSKRDNDIMGYFIIMKCGMNQDVISLQSQIFPR